jgi:hypothetical protein
VKHLATRSGSDISRLGDLLVSGVKQLVYEADPKVGLALSQLLLVMGSEGYLVHEGGQSLVTFLINNCSPGRAGGGAGDAGTGSGSGGSQQQAPSSSSSSAAQQQPGSPSPAAGKDPRDVAALRASCERILDRLAGEVPAMEKVLWPFLFEFLVPAQYTEALPVILRNIALLGNRKREKGDSSFYIDFAKNVNAPKPHAIVGRLLVMLNAPARRDLGAEILKALTSIAPILNDHIARMWEAALPRLLAFLQAKLGTPDWDDAVWSELTLRLFRETLECIGDEEWLIHLSEDFATQFDLYMRDTDLKRAISLYLGLVLQKVSKRSLIRGKLDRMFDVVDHGNPVDRHACAQGFGYAAVSHMDTCVEKLQHALKNDCVAKSSGFFGMVKDKNEKDIDNVKSTVMLCFGFVAGHAPAGMVTTRLEVHILNNSFIPELADCKSATRKAAVFRALDHIARASNPATLGVDFTLKARDDLLMKSIVLLNASPTEINLEIRSLWVQAATTFAALPPILSPDAEVHPPSIDRMEQTNQIN